MAAFVDADSASTSNRDATASACGKSMSPVYEPVAAGVRATGSELVVLGLFIVVILIV